MLRGHIVLQIAPNVKVIVALSILGFLHFLHFSSTSYTLPTLFLHFLHIFLHFSYTFLHAIPIPTVGIISSKIPPISY